MRDPPHEASPFRASDVTVVIPTLGRDEVLVNTIRGCLHETCAPSVVVVVDQTPGHDAETSATLAAWHDAGRIVWERTSHPSQPAAMNRGLKLARTPLVLFLDDDIEPTPGFIAAHAASYTSPTIWAVVGQIVQPWQQPTDLDRATQDHGGLRRDLDFPFHTTRTYAQIFNLMSGHVSVRLDRALELRGFDENYRGVAFRFDTDFGRRIVRAGGDIKFDPTASIKHLRAVRGGTRSLGGHLASPSPNHGQGDYYFAMRHGTFGDSVRYCLARIVREVRTRFHLRHPWHIPTKLLGELRALIWAWRLSRQGPALLPDKNAQAAIGANRDPDMEHCATAKNDATIREGTHTG